MFGGLSAFFGESLLKARFVVSFMIGYFEGVLQQIREVIR